MEGVGWDGIGRVVGIGYRGTIYKKIFYYKSPLFLFIIVLFTAGMF